MYKIAICEDENIFRCDLEKICRDICSRLSIEYTIFMFENGEMFWREFSSGKRYDLLLLDILMGEISGMELAVKIRKLDSDATIIFITSNIDYAIQGYDVNAMHFLLKPPDSDTLEKLIATDYQKRFKSNVLIFKSGGQVQRIPVRDVIFLETVGRKVKITLQNGTAEYPGKLSDLINGKENLIRCHNAFAVNITAIRELTRQDAVAYNGAKIPVSRTFSKSVQKALLKQIRDTNG